MNGRRERPVLMASSVVQLSLLTKIRCPCNSRDHNLRLTVTVGISSEAIVREATSMNGGKVEWKKRPSKKPPIPARLALVQKREISSIQGDERNKETPLYAKRKCCHQRRSARSSGLGEK